ncbi:MAG: TlpA family protein disulfide reductase [Gorillibacterium sp.]|nr:TlpA family protein disulfide reductase [Gorillibacterium sp.]
MKWRTGIVVFAAVLLIWVVMNSKDDKRAALALAAKQDMLNKGETNLGESKVAPRAGSLAPPFSLKSLDGKVYNVDAKREKPLLLTFWASWCGPCKEEAPLLSLLHNKYKNQIDVYAVNVTAEDRIRDVEAFAKRYSFSFPVLLDVKGEVAVMYRIYGIPTSFLIDRNGSIVEVIHTLDAKEWEQRVNKLIEDNAETE